ncbi:MAG: efflux RND transporter permease subunit [Chloroflexota bacterium]
MSSSESQRPTKPKLNGMIISDTAIKQPVFITMLVLLGFVFGFLGYFSLPVNLLPDISLPVVSVRVVNPGASPESMAEQVARPIENELSTLSGVNEISSTSSDSLTVIVVEFVDGTDVASALQEVREKVTAIRARLPDDIQEPVYERLDPSQTPIVTLAVTGGNERDPREVRNLLENEIVPNIQQAEGVGSVSLNGGLVRQINVELDLGRMQALGILPSQVSNAIAAANADFGLGSIQVGEQEFNLRAPSVFQSYTDIASVGIEDTGYTVGDIAQIRDSQQEVETFVRVNGEETISLAIRKQADTNTVAVAETAIATAEETFSRYSDLEFTVIRDESVQIREQVNGAIEEMIIAMLFAILVVWFFFRDIRNTLVTVLGLPIIIIATFSLMSFLGISLNVISLLALSVAVGLVIDDAIVVRENIFRHIQRGEDPYTAASRGTAQVAAAVVAMTLTIVVVFTPVAFTDGVTGVIFGAFGLTIVGAMLLSITEAFTLAPMTSANWFQGKQAVKPLKIKPGEEHLPDEAHEELGRSEALYERFLAWSLKHRLLILGFTVIVIIVSILAASTLKFSFFPNVDNHQFTMSIELPPGTFLSETDRVARDAEQILLQDEAVTTVLTTVGTDGAAEKVDFLVNLHHDAPSNETRERIRPEMEDLPGIVSFSQSTPDGGDTVSVTGRPLQMQLRTTEDVDTIAPLVDEIMTAFEGVEGLDDLDTTYKPGAPQLEYQLIQQRANDYNLTNQTLALILRTLNEGDTAAIYREAGQEYDVVVRLQPEDRQNIDDLRAVQLPLGNSIIPLASVTDAVESTSPTSIRRVDRLNEVVIGGNNINRNINDVQADMQARLADIDIPSNVAVSFGGSTADQTEGFSALIIAMGLSVLLVYVVLASQFGSFFQPLVIMLAMPLSFLGAFVALWLVGLELDIVAMIGMLMLMGVVVKNSILLVEFTNQLRDAGMSKHAALERAGAIRLRPILMTAATLVLAAFPSALGIGEGSELRRPLSTVIIGGVTTSTLLTLILVPTAYSLMEGLIDRTKNLFRRTAKQPSPTMENQVLAHAGATSGDGNLTSTTAMHHHGEDGMRGPATNDTTPAPQDKPQELRE